MNEVILITARHKVNEIEKVYHDSCNIMSFDSWFVIKNLEKYKEIEALFNDERSKDVLNLLLMAMLTGEHEKYCSMAYDDKQYFCLPQFVNGHNEHFIDAGSFVGDTLEQFIWNKAGNFSQIYCFEPGKKQFKSLQKRCNRLINEWAIDEHKIILVNAGLGNKSYSMGFNISNDSLQSLSFLTEEPNQTTAENIPVYTIDEYFRDIPVSYIKVDIEGYEMKLLHGASNTIRKNKPKLALCTYHGANDIFDFIAFLTDIVPEYKFALRHHSFSILETVLYCYVE